MNRIMNRIGNTIALAALLWGLVACDTNTPSAPASVIVQADISSVGLVILYRDQSEPQDKYERIDYELRLRGAHVSSGSVAKHAEIPIDVSGTGVGEYVFVSEAKSRGGDLVGTGVFEISVTGL